MVGGSQIGGMKETQEMLEFCAKHKIVSDIELIKMSDINSAMDRLVKSDVRYRFVIDVANSLLPESSAEILTEHVDHGVSITSRF